MRLSRPSRKLVLLLIIAVCGPAAALGLARREQVAFAARCWGNGNGLGACICTYNALAELPPSYRDLAVTWAHDAGTAYATGVMQLIAAETWRVSAAKIERLASIGDRQKSLGTWIWHTADAIGWAALKEAAPAVASTLAPIVAVLPLVDDALGEFARAQEVLGRHCGTGKSFLVRVYETRRAAAEKLEALTALTTEVAAGMARSTARSTAEGSAGMAARVWAWARSWF